MQRVLFTLLALSAVAASADAVILFETDTRILHTQEWVGDFDICLTGADFAIGTGDPADAAGLRFATVLDGSFRSLDDYSVIHISNPDGLIQAARLGTILFDGEGLCLVKLSSPVLPDGALPGIHQMQPLRVTAVSAPITLPVTMREGMDDNISDMVAAVSESGYQGYIQQLQNYLTRYSSTDNYDTAASWVETTFEGFGLDAELQYFDMGSYNCENVIAEMPGQVDSTKIVIVCGHLDSTSPQSTTNAPGADDNASGSAVVVEAARIMSGYTFENTVRFICFGGEEQGLYGSAFYADEAGAAGEDIIAVINLDMVLYGPPGQDICWVPYNTASTGLALAFDAICDTYVPALDVLTEYSPGTTYSDHSSFWNQGYAAILGIEQEVFSNPYYHQTTDILANYMSYFPFGTNCTKGAIAAAAYLAVPIGGVGIEEGEWQPVDGVPLISGIGPNPAFGSLGVSLAGDAGEVFFRVYDLSGRVALDGTESFTGSSLVLDISTLPSGVFVLEVGTGGNTDTARFAVLR